MLKSKTNYISLTKAANVIIKIINLPWYVKQGNVFLIHPDQVSVNIYIVTNIVAIAYFLSKYHTGNT